MWEPDLPDVDDHLRQGDLLMDQPMPSRGTYELTVSGLFANVKPSVRAVVLERCCSVENRMTVLLARVGRAQNGGPDHRMTQALRSDNPQPGSPYAFYDHLLEPLGDVLPADDAKLWVVQLLERVSIAAKSHDELVSLRERRVARMTVLERARLRAKLVAHWSSPEAEDNAWLAANGFDQMGRPLAPTTTES